MQQATPGRTAQVVSNKFKVSGKVGRVSSTVTSADPQAGTRASGFTRVDFEDALDKVSRPAKTPERA